MPRGAAAKQDRKEKKARAKAEGVDLKAKEEDELASILGEDPMAKMGSMSTSSKEPDMAFDDPVAQLEKMQAAQKKFETRKCCADSDEDEGEGEEQIQAKIAKGQKKRKKERMAEEKATKGYFGEIKTLPLLFLVLLTAGGTLPVLFWVADNAPRILKNFGTGSKLGYKLGLGEIPRQRVTSFYEKHNPEKLGEVDAVLSKYYGDYKSLTRKLERKYKDYGYFLGWEGDDAASTSTAIVESLQNFRENSYRAYRKKAPKALVQAGDNFYYNVGGLVKPAQKYWKKTIWPFLKPLVYVPDAKEAKKQKDKDRKAYGAKKRGKKSGEFRDDDEM